MLERNSWYRFGDIVNTKGHRYRLDSATILCEPRYRSSLLRQMLFRTALLDGATAIKDRLTNLVVFFRDELAELTRFEEGHTIAVNMARMHILTYYEVHRYIHSHKQKMLGKDDKNALKKGSLIVVMQY